MSPRPETFFFLVSKQINLALDFLKVVRLVFWSGVVGPGTNFRSLALRAHSRATRSKARLVSKSNLALKSIYLFSFGVQFLW